MKKTLLLLAFVIIIAAGAFWYIKSGAEESGKNSNTITASYLCDENRTIDIVFHNSEPKLGDPGEPPIPTGSVDVALSDGRKFNLPQTVSADGSRYANSDESFVFWSKGNGALVLENNVEKSYIGCLVVVPDPGNLPNAYSDGGAGFSIRYPADYSIDASYQYQALGPGKEIGGVRFTIPESIKEGTNLSSYDTGVSVEILPATQDCKVDLFLDREVESELLTDEGREYSFASTTEAAAGNRYEEYVWAVPGTNPCIAVRYMIHYGVIENYPEGTVREFDRSALLNQFDEIRHSLILQ